MVSHKVLKIPILYVGIDLPELIRLKPLGVITLDSLLSHLVGIDLPELIRLKLNSTVIDVEILIKVGIDLPELFKRKFLVMPE